MGIRHRNWGWIRRINLGVLFRGSRRIRSKKADRLSPDVLVPNWAQTSQTRNVISRNQFKLVLASVNTAQCSCAGFTLVNLPLVIWYSHSYWKRPCIVDLPIKMVIFLIQLCWFTRGYWLSSFQFCRLKSCRPAADAKAAMIAPQAMQAGPVTPRTVWNPTKRWGFPSMGVPP